MMHTSLPPSTLVRGGTIVGGCGRWRGDLLIQEGKIAAVAAPGKLADAELLIDAEGLLVLPGLVDSHVHLRDPGMTHKEDFRSGTAAAAAGGITTVLVMPLDDPVVDSADVLLTNAANASGRSFVDYGFEAAAGPLNSHRIPELGEAGAFSVEVMLGDAPASVGTPDLWEFRTILTQAKSAGLVTGVYCEVGSITAGARHELINAGRRDLAAFVASHPPVAEILGAALTCSLAAEVGGPVHLRQLSTREAVEIAAVAKKNQADVTMEVCPHHMSLATDDLREPAADFKVSPPLRTRADVEAMKQAVASEIVDIVASDHAPHAPAEKAAGRKDIWLAPAGLAGLETALSVILESFPEIGPEILVRAFAEAPARRFGLAHRKGRIEVGLDADLVLLDPDTSWLVDVNRLHTRAASSPFAARHLPGKIRYTLLRGRVISDEGQVTSEPDGQWLRPNRPPGRGVDGPAGLAGHLAPPRARRP